MLLSSWTILKGDALKPTLRAMDSYFRYNANRLDDVISQPGS